MIPHEPTDFQGLEKFFVKAILLCGAIAVLVLATLYLAGCTKVTINLNEDYSKSLAILEGQVDQATELREQAAAQIDEYLRLGDIAAEFNPALTFKERYQIGKAVKTYSDVYGIEPGLIMAVILVESSGRVDAVSPKGAVGLMQVMPQWPERLGLDGADLTDIETNINLGTFILADNVQRWGLKEGVQRYFWGTGKPDGTYYGKVLRVLGRIDGRV